MDVKYAALRLVVRQRELNLPINAAGPDECWVQRVDPVGRHDYLRNHMSVSTPGTLPNKGRDPA